MFAAPGARKGRAPALGCCSSGRNHKSGLAHIKRCTERTSDPRIGGAHAIESIKRYKCAIARYVDYSQDGVFPTCFAASPRRLACVNGPGSGFLAKTYIILLARTCPLVHYVYILVTLLVTDINQIELAPRMVRKSNKSGCPRLAQSHIPKKQIQMITIYFNKSWHITVQVGRYLRGLSYRLGPPGGGGSRTLISLLPRFVACYTHPLITLRGEDKSFLES